jgi:spore maturation protein A
LATILPFSETREGELLARVRDQGLPEPGWQNIVAGFPGMNLGLVFEPVRFRKLGDITQAAFDMADTAFELALGLTGVLCLWLGLVKIAEDAGLVFALVKVVRPLLGLIFPEIPKDHPALGMIALNLAANMLGLGNAATPMGLKAMEELQKLNETEDTATNSMCMFLAVNTASVQLVPPATLVAIMGVSTGKLWLPILIVTGLSLLIAITAAKALSLAPVFARSDPRKNPRPVAVGFDEDKRNAKGGTNDA